MGEHDQVQHELIARLERLEKRDRRLKQGAVVCLFLFICIGVIAQTKKKSVAVPKTAPPAPPGTDHRGS